MSGNFATWSIRQPIPSIVAFLLAVAVGLYGFGQLHVSDMPDVDLPAVTVNAVLQGASPAQLETEVTRKIENAVATVGDIEHIISTVTEGISSTTVQFRLEKNPLEALNDVRAAVSSIRGELPREMEEPIVSKINIAGRPILTFSVSSDSMDEEGLSWFADDTVTRKLLAVPGVGRVKRIGGVDREIRIELDPAQLNALNLSAAGVSRQLGLVQKQLSGGRAEIGSARQSLRTLGAVGTAAELGALDIALPNGQHRRLDQIATISDTVADRNQLALLDGQTVVCVQIERSRGSSAVAVAEAVGEAIDELAAANPSMHFTLVHDSVTRIRHEYSASMTMLWEGALLAMLVVWLFLRDWRATLISATALPLSVIPTFAALYWLGFSLNTVTLLALSLVIGLLVDDAIVEVENIVRHLREGKSPRAAAMEAATEIGLAVIATSLALVAVFLPTAMMGGIPGMMFKQFGWTAVVAVLASLAVARLITPMLAAWLLSDRHEPARRSALLERYLVVVDWSLRHRHRVILMAAAVFAGSLALIAYLPPGFIPAGDVSQTELSVELAPGSTLEDTRATVGQVLNVLRDVPEISRVFTAIGAGGSRDMSAASVGDVRRATLHLQLVERRNRDRSQTEVENDLRGRLEAVPGARFTIGDGGRGQKLQLVLSGDDADELRDAASAVVRDMRAMPGLGNVHSNATLLRPEIIITPNAARAAELGVTADSIGETLHVATAGDYDTALPKLDLPNRQVDIRVQLPLAARRDLATLEQLRIPANGGLVPLGSVAKLSIGSATAQIERYDRSRNINIDAELGGMSLGEVTRQINNLPSIVNLPPGIRKLDAGDAEMMKETFESFFTAMGAGTLCVYLVMVLLFKDFLQPITILAALPLALGGAFIGLLLAGESLSMPAMIGLLMLTGISSKNSILLVEYAISAMRDRGMQLEEALRDACHKRARPIIMTTLAMIAGMLPVALGFDSDGSFRAPMAVAVIGGLISSTLLSLVVVPVVFTYVHTLKLWLTRALPNRVGYPDSTAITGSARQ